MEKEQTMCYSPVQTTTGQAFLILVTNGQGDREGRSLVLADVSHAERCVEDHLNRGVPVERIKVFQVRPFEPAFATVAAA